jgi:hypothetical protein
MIAGALGLLVSLVVFRDGAPWATRDRTVVREEHLL